MKMDVAVREFGSRTAVARALGISVTSTYDWIDDQVPLLRQYQLQRLTYGRLRAQDPLFDRRGKRGKPKRAA